MKEEKLFDSFEYLGKWWLPSTPDSKIDGTLSYTPKDKFELRLMSPLITEPHPYNLNLKFPAIHGQLDGGEIVTVLNATSGGFNMGGAGFHRASYHIGFAFAGLWFADEADVKFDSLLVTFRKLPAWMAIDAIETDGLLDYKVKQKLTITHHARPVFEFRVEAKNLTIKSSPGVRRTGSPWAGITVQPTQSFRFIFDNPVGLEEASDVEFRFTQLITLLGGEAFLPEHVLGFTSDVNVRKGGVVVASEKSHSFSVINQLAFHREPDVEHPQKFLFRYADVADIFPAIVNTWFGLRSNLGEVIDIFNFVRRMPDLPIDLTFLSLAQGLESMHSRMHPEKFVSKADSRKVRETVVAAIPAGTHPGLLRNITNALAHINTYSLADRLRHLVELLEPESRAFVTSDQDKFVDSIKDTRNYRTHLGNKDDYTVLDNRDLWGANIRMEVLLTFHLLKHVGVPEALVRKRLNESMRYDLTQVPLL